MDRKDQIKSLIEYLEVHIEHQERGARKVTLSATDIACLLHCLNNELKRVKHA